jgi:hypothetical protein
MLGLSQSLINFLKINSAFSKFLSKYKAIAISNSEIISFLKSLISHFFEINS